MFCRLTAFCLALLVAAPATADTTNWSITVISSTEAMVGDVKLNIRDIPGYLRGSDPNLKKTIVIRARNPDATPYKVVSELMAGIKRVGYTQISLDNAPERKTFDADKIAALLDKTPGKKPINDDVLGAITQQLKACTRLPGSERANDVPAVTARFHLNPDGSLDGDVTILQPEDTPLFKIGAEATVRAVKACTPFKLPADRYDQWKTVTWKFDWQQIVRNSNGQSSAGETPNAAASASSGAADPPKPDKRVDAAVNGQEIRRAVTAPGGAIVALVNGEPIIGYHVEARTLLILRRTDELGLRVALELRRKSTIEQFKSFSIQRLKANPPQSEKDQEVRVKALKEEYLALVRKQVETELRPKIAKEALTELIEERLKMIEARRRNVVATEEAVAREIAYMDGRKKGANKKIIDSLGSDKERVLASRKEFVLTELSWRNVVKAVGGNRLSKAAFEETSDRTLQTLKLDSNIEYR